MVICATITISKNFTIQPYAITVDGEDVCYVETKEDAAEVIKTLSDDYAVPDAKVTGFSSEKLKTQKKDSAVNKSEVSNVEEAVEEIKNATEETKLDVTVSSVKSEIVETKPTIKYIKDDSMLAGETKTEEKGEPGITEVTKNYTTVNGEITNQDTVSVFQIDAGSPTVIRKGTLGLPEGEDWETYEGDPVCENGDEIAEIAKSYDGKVNYVWGGKNLETGVDCSGFVICIYKKFGVSLGYPLQNEGVSVSYENAMPGDILCFPTHFGLYIGDGMMVDARQNGGVAIRTVSSLCQPVIDVRRIIS